MGRRSKSKEVKERAFEIKDQAREVAGQSGEALKEFAAHTGNAAKEFATKASDAAKELVDSIEKAAKSVGEEAEEPRRGRRLLKVLIVGGAGIAIATNERARAAISKALGGSRTGSVDQPEIWRPESPDGGNAQRTTTTTPGPTTTP